MKKTILLSCLSFLAVSAYAQRFIGVSNDAYNTANAMYLNPAYLGGCNEKIAVNMLGVSIGVDNNLGTLTTIGNIGKTGDSGVSVFKTSVSGGKFSMMVPGVELRGPSVVYRINAQHTLAFTTRIRGFNEFNNFDKALYTAVSDPNGINTSAISFNAQNFNWTAHVWSEMGLSYGVEAYKNDKISVKGGASIRYLAGIGYLGIKGKNMDVNYTSANDSLRANNTDIEYASNIQTVSDNINNGISASRFFGGPSGGSGIGMDLGAIVTYKKENEQEPYTALLSVAVTDIGQIAYRNSYDVVIKGNGYLKGQEIGDSVANYQDLRSYALRHGFSVDTSTTRRSVHLPTAMVIGADYHAWKKFYVNATILTGLTGDGNFGSKYYSQVSLIPRYQSRLLSASLPITYSMLSHSMRMGLGFRFGGLYMGSDDLLAAFSNNQYGFNFYFGGMIPIYRKAKDAQTY